MNIAWLKNMGSMDYRIQHFINTLKKNHTIYEIDTIKHINITRYDMVLIDYFSANSNDAHKEMCDRINSFKDNLLKFKGKIVLYSLDDGQAVYNNEVDFEIINRIDAWIVYMINECFLNACPKHKDILNKKFIKIPRYTLPYVKSDDVVYENKENKIVFIGKTTGNYWFNGKNWRIEALNKIWDNNFLKKHFDGWLVDDCIIDVPKQNDEYNKTFKFVKKDQYLSEKDWYQKLKNSTLSLCIPGHTKLGYRHPQSMVFKSTMLANFDLENDPYPWLFSEKLKDISYTVKPDLSNFIETCEEALLNKEKTKSYAYAAYDVYKTYLEPTEKNTYQDHVWSVVKEQFNKLGFCDI